MSKNEIAKLPQEITKVVKEKGSSLTEAQSIAINYAPFMEEVTKQMNKLAGAKPKKGEDPTPEQVEIASRVRKDLSNRVNGAVGRQKDSDKELTKIKNKFIDSLHNTVLNASKMTQNEAKEIEEFYARKEAARKEELKNKRTDLLLEFMEEDNIVALGTSLGDMEESVFEAFLEGKKKQKAELEEAERVAKEKAEEEERLAKLYAERKEQLIPYWNYLKGDQVSTDFSALPEESFETILKEVKEAKKADDKKKAKLEAEAAELRKKETKRKERGAEMQPYIIFIRDYDKMIDMSDADYEKALSDIKRAYKEQKEFEAKQEKERLAEEKKQQEIKAKEEKERLAKIEAEKKAKAAPDKEKLKKLIEDINNLELPEVSSDEAKKVVEEVEGLLGKVNAYIDKKIKNL